jgi:hypothetical protein
VLDGDIGHFIYPVGLTERSELFNVISVLRLCRFLKPGRMVFERLDRICNTSPVFFASALPDPLGTSWLRAGHEHDGRVFDFGKLAGCAPPIARVERLPDAPSIYFAIAPDWTGAFQVRLPFPAVRAGFQVPAVECQHFAFISPFGGCRQTYTATRQRSALRLFSCQ